MPLPGFTAQQPQSWAPTSSSIYEMEAPLSSSYAPGTPFADCQIRIRRLPADTQESQLRLMLLFSQELVDVNILPLEMSRDPGFCSAIVQFKTTAGAQLAKEMLHGKSMFSNSLELIIEYPIESPAEPPPESLANARKYPHENTISTQTNGSAPITSPSATARQPSRFNESFSPSSFYPNNEVDAEYYQSIFSPQSPIGNHLANQTLSLGKNLIHNTAEDDETRELLKDPVAYAENGATQQRRATAPHLPLARMGNLSLNTTNGASPMTSFPHSNMTPLSAHNGMSPTLMNGANHSMNFQHNYPRTSFPAVNPADQNPPCNTLYVGNLPVDTSEEELKSIFQKQRGYKRLCFRTKQNGPMCFVEFEDVTHATRALHELYGKPLHNSTKGGIRLSFSKNPLGVRSNQTAGSCSNGSMASMNGLMGTPTNGFPVTSGPPPGLTAPPGLHRVNMNGSQPISNGGNPPIGYPGSNGTGWNPQYNGSHSAGGNGSPPNGQGNHNYPPYNWSDRP
ncbi:hypothetical protein GGS21DRAFT_259828 [Xylaria nigripes]|nr:hypothetical protein GGS21DRAFT_259828 [Xylaria nigripes]